MRYLGGVSVTGAEGGSLSALAFEDRRGVYRVSAPLHVWGVVFGGLAPGVRGDGPVEFTDFSPADARAGVSRSYAGAALVACGCSVERFTAAFQVF